MIHDFDDFCAWMYVVVDDIWRPAAWLSKRPGAAPICSDSELMTMALVSVRQVIETVNSQLGEQFHIETNHAHSFWGLCTRLVTKLTAHALSIYTNRLPGKTHFLQIKALAFPI